MNRFALYALTLTVSAAFTMEQPPQRLIAQPRPTLRLSAHNSRINPECCIKAVTDPAVIATTVVGACAHEHCGTSIGYSCLFGATVSVCALAWAADPNDPLSDHYYSTQFLNSAKSKFFDIFPCMARPNTKSE